MGGWRYTMLYPGILAEESVFEHKHRRGHKVCMEQATETGDSLAQLDILHRSDPSGKYLPKTPQRRMVSSSDHRDQAVDEIVVGYPLTMRGSASSQTKSVDKFIAELRTQHTIPVYHYDERLTSVAARRNLAQSGGRTKSEKGAVDKMAAALLLQDFIDSRK